VAKKPGEVIEKIDVKTKAPMAMFGDYMAITKANGLKFITLENATRLRADLAPLAASFSEALAWTNANDMRRRTRRIAPSAAGGGAPAIRPAQAHGGLANWPSPLLGPIAMRARHLRPPRRRSVAACAPHLYGNQVASVELLDLPHASPVAWDS